MSWMQTLYRTYEQGVTLRLPEDEQLMPISHTLQNAHINIVIDGAGNFKRAQVLKKTQVMLPATEKSASRGNGELPHPLADKLQYVAQDYAKYGGMKKAYFDGYQKQLLSWCESEFVHPKVSAIYQYISKGEVLKDLIAANIVCVDEQGVLLRRWSDETQATPELFSVLPKEKGELDQGSALVCWSVEIAGDPSSDTWKDPEVQASWVAFDTANAAAEGFCYIQGAVVPLAINHPAKLRNTGDKAKLISSNDDSGFTYRGKFLDDAQASGIGFEVTQKAHNALRWLISRQGFRAGSTNQQVIVAWAVSGKPVLNPMEDPYDFAIDEDEEDWGEEAVMPEVSAPITDIDHSLDLGQMAALKFKKKLNGYFQKLDETERLSIMAIDSATTGRMGVTYYRECLATEYFQNLDRWYSEFAWYQRHTAQIPQLTDKKPKPQTIWPILSPAPRTIADAAYGKTLTDTLRKNLYERVLPCITEGKPFPLDILNLCIARACNPSGGDRWEWERNVAVTCALYRGFYSRHPKLNERRTYSMALEIENTSRDYLYGRLLAVAERIEEIALSVAGEKRATTAERYIQRFAERPFSAWRNIELALDSYKQRLRNSRPGFLTNRENELQDIMALFQFEDFIRDDKLSGEFLLGYHCQKRSYRKKTDAESEVIAEEAVEA